MNITSSQGLPSQHLNVNMCPRDCGNTPYWVLRLKAPPEACSESILKAILWYVLPRRRLRVFQCDPSLPRRLCRVETVPSERFKVYNMSYTAVLHETPHRSPAYPAQTAQQTELTWAYRCSESNLKAVCPPETSLPSISKSICPPETVP